MLERREMKVENGVLVEKRGIENDVLIGVLEEEGEINVENCP